MLSESTQLACAIPVGVITVVGLLHAYLPAYRFEGYVCDEATGRPLSYRLNGLRVLLVVDLLALFDLALTAGSRQAYGSGLLLLLADQIWACFAVSFLLGLAAAVLLGFRSGFEPADLRMRCSTVDAPGKREPSAEEKATVSSRNPAANFFFGWEWNPRLRWWRLGGLVEVDVKMLLYLIGAAMLRLNLMAALAAHVRAASPGGQLGRELGLPQPESVAGLLADGLKVVGASCSEAAWVYHLLLSFFCYEYMYFETVHTYTYDLFAERVGFKLAWGCLLFYPFFYCIGAWSLTSPASAAAQMPGPPYLASVALVLLYLGGWVFSRGANLQKYHLKRSPECKSVFCGLVEQETLRGEGRLLVSGFWGLARHVNYAGEIVQALAVSLAPALATGSWVPMLYPLYYVALFIPREMDDQRICEAKYGSKFTEYCQRVPYRIVPGLY